MFIFSSKKGSSNPRDVEEHRNTNLYECLDNTIFLLLNRGDIFRIKATSIKGVDQTMDEDNKEDGHGSDPIGVINSLLFDWLLLLLVWLMLKSVHIFTCATIEHQVRLLLVITL
jgi:hypothetical protein